MIKSSAKIGWVTSKLGDCFQIKHGYAFKGEFFAETKGPYIVLTPGNFYEEGGLKLKGEKEKYYVGEIPPEFILNRGDLLVVMTEQAEGLLGSSAFIPESDRFLHNQRLGLITSLDANRIDRHFLYYLFNFRGVREQIRATANGAKVRHTSPSRIYEVVIELPLPLVQRKIASILSAYDDHIENNMRRIRSLEETARMLYDEWFMNFRFPGHEKVKMVESDLGLIPEEWRTSRFGDLGNISREGISPSKFEGEIFAHYSFEAFDTGCIPILQEGEAIRSNKFIVVPNCVLLSKLNPRIPRVWFPYPQGANRAITSTEFLVIVPKKPFTPEYLYCFCRSDGFSRRLAGRALGTSSSHQRVKTNDLVGLIIVAPLGRVVEVFTKSVSPMLEQIGVLHLKNENLRRTRNLLLPKLISGELDVEKLDIAVPEDSPAGETAPVASATT